MKIHRNQQYIILKNENFHAQFSSNKLELKIIFIDRISNEISKILIIIIIIVNVSFLF
jgi:hypothetical protein